MTNAFGRLIKSQRNKMGFTQQQVADLVIVSSIYIQKIEKGDEIPSPEMIYKLSPVLFCNVKVLLKLAKNIKVDRYIENINNKYKFRGK